MKGKLHWKLTAVFCSAVLVGLLLGYFYLTANLKSFLDQDLQDHLKRELSLSKGFIEDRIRAAGTLENPYALAQRMGTETGVRVTIVSADGVVLGDSELSLEEVKKVENHAGRPEIKDAFLTGFGVNRRYSHTIKKYLLYVAVPFGKGQANGVLRFAMPLSDVQLFEAGLDKVALLTLCLVFLMSLGFTYLIAIVISRPLREMAVVAKAIADGDFSQSPSVRSKDEVGDLASAITHMSQQIRTKIEDIEEEKAKLDAILASMFEGIMVVDEKGVVLLMNPSLRKIFFIDTPPEGRRSVEVIRNSVVTEMTDKLLKGAERFVSQDVFVGFPEEKMLKANGVAILAADRLEGAVLVFHDITELRRLEKVRQDFVANVSHELRTPVASIKGYAETLLEGAINDQSNARDFVGIIHENSERLASLINDLLDLAKIESGKMQMVFMPVELQPVVSRCLGVLEKPAAKKSLKIAVEIPENLLKVRADEGRLAQVLLNLFDNAVKYTPEGGTVIVRALLDQNLVRVEVEDTGVGIPESDLPRIFERFYRVDKARSRELGGTGLGLSIVKHIVLAHGGDVFVRSEIGRGSTFSFTIPTA